MNEDVTYGDGEEVEEPSGADRRRHRRLEFSKRCLLSLQTPAWAMTPKPLSAITENVTEHGLRIRFERIPLETIQSWEEAISQDVELSAEIVIQELSEFPPLRGQIVWVDIQGPSSELEGTPDVVASVGVLFFVQRGRDSGPLKKLVESLE